MRIAIVSHDDATGTGAGRMASELVQLINKTQDLEAFHFRGSSALPETMHSLRLHGNQLGQVFFKSTRFLSRKVGLADFLSADLMAHRLSAPHKYDIYHFHSISGSFSPVSLRWIAKRTPSVWTFHDFSPFTGGCTFPALTHCDKYLTKCGDCPQLNTWPMFSWLDFTGQVQAYKRRLAREGLFVPVVPSRWLAREAYKTGMFKEEPRVIPNCVDLEQFQPLDKGEARAMFGLPQRQFIVLIGAASLSNKRKGVAYALEAVSLMEKRPYVVAFGRNGHDLSEGGVPVHYIGHVLGKDRLAALYSAADVFLFPSLSETFGLVAVEAMACGTPVVAFKSGAIPEIVGHDVDGWLARTGDVTGLVAGLEIAMEDEVRLRAWGENGLERVRRCFGPNDYLNRHLDLYDGLMMESGKR